MKDSKYPFLTKPIIAWAIFDWASSAFPTIITTFIFATYFSERVAPNKITGTALWADAIAIAGVMIAILSPVLGAVADYEGRRKPWLSLCTLAVIISACMLWAAQPQASDTHYALGCVIVGTIGLEVGMVFYNAMLSDLAPAGYIGRISGWSWGFGYLGGLTSLIVALYVFIHGEGAWLGLSENYEYIRITGPLVGLWTLLFAWPLFVYTRDQPSTGLGFRRSVWRGLLSLKRTLSSLRNYKNVMLFLLARMLYTDGLNTVFAFGGIYAAGTFGLSFTQVVQFGIAMNVAAGIGAASFAWMDDYKGAKLTVLVTVCIMIVSGIGMLLATSQLAFWILGMCLSLCVGPIQAASRSLLIHIAPRHLITEMFGLYAFSGKATAFVGPYLLGVVTLWSNSQRAGMATVVIFLTAGAVLLTKVQYNPD